jgi:hypothetical protein
MSLVDVATHTIGWVAVATVGALLVLNGSIMVFSPALWFRMPSWLAARGTMRASDYATGPRAVFVRLMGAAWLGTVAWVLYEAAWRH